MNRNQNRSKLSAKWAKQRPSRVAGWVGRRPPRVWASLYILMIPLAGFIYWSLPVGSFYDSNLPREAGYKHDLISVANLLTKAIQHQEHGYDTGRPLQAPTWNAYGIRLALNVSTLHIPPESMSVDSSGIIKLTVRFFATSVTHSPFGEGVFGDLVTLSPIEGFEGTPTGTFADIPASFTATSGSGNGQVPLNILLPPATGFTYSNQSLMLVPPGTATVVEHLTAAAAGDPKEASGLFVRMCYFSAITITTLGFGDITPVSSMARVLVGVEAVLGVVFIGLFLNAVAQKAGKDSDRTPT
jgi:hypothetical protein